MFTTDFPHEKEEVDGKGFECMSVMLSAGTCSISITVSGKESQSDLAEMKFELSVVFLELFLYRKPSD